MNFQLGKDISYLTFQRTKITVKYTKPILFNFLLKRHFNLSLIHVKLITVKKKQSVVCRKQTLKTTGSIKKNISMYDCLYTEFPKSLCCIYPSSLAFF